MATITGTTGNDNGIDNPVLMGTEDDDVISGRSGNDSLVGLGGDDFLAPGTGANWVEGGEGNDTILLSTPNDFMSPSLIDGGDGIDRLVLDAASGRSLGIRHATLRDIEIIDLREGSLTLLPQQLEDVTQVVGFGVTQDFGFGRAGELLFVGGTSVELGGITVGVDNSAVGRAAIRTSFGNATIDASGATASWEIYSSSGVDLLIGGEGNDTLIGVEHGDTLRGGAGDDILSHAQMDEDELIASGRIDDVEDLPWTVLDGGEGRDTVASNFVAVYSRVSFLNMEVFEGLGYMSRAHILSFEEFQDLGGLGMTTAGRIDLTGLVTSARYHRSTGAAYFIFEGSAWSDEIIKTDTRNAIEVFAQTGNDTVVTGATNDLIDEQDSRGGGGHDSINSGDGRDTVYGGSGHDVIITWATDADVNDSVYGGFGNDYIETGAGNDLATANLIEDTRAPSIGDTIDGGLGSDRIYGADGDDLLIGGPNDGDLADRIYGRSGNDSILAGAGNDSVGGGAGDDTIVGGTGSDTLTGNGGDDLISGGSIADLIFGGSGADFINGGFGNDLLNGGEGADRFFHAAVEGHGSDWIQDFSEEDALVAVDSARASDFQVNFSNTDGAGDAGVDEAFVIYRPSGQILWALVDGGDLTSLTLRIEEVDYDLLV
ncbi:calcium-binding protein [Shimia thalassica]|uniref:calcium-binding protein n=1 Tax=Shimia thalassica TaxID=1715693 RepID=UPI0026E2375A|nr:calcium-binding protein [Shimia thalassica]MDO6797666.1 calcium-binding protein [Shimia thalassica]